MQLKIDWSLSFNCQTLLSRQIQIPLQFKVWLLVEAACITLPQAAEKKLSLSLNDVLKLCVVSAEQL